MAIKVEMSAGEAKRLKEEWEQRLYSLEAEAEALRQSIASIDAQLNGRLETFEDLPPITRKPIKRNKGENLRTITSFLRALSGKGATSSEISKGTGVGMSSCQLVLKRHKDLFSKGTDGLWRVK